MYDDIITVFVSLNLINTTSFLTSFLSYLLPFFLTFLLPFFLTYFLSSLLTSFLPSFLSSFLSSLLPSFLPYFLPFFLTSFLSLTYIEERLQNMVASHYNKDDNRDLAEGLKMRSLSRLLLFVFPHFGIVYILRLAGVIDRDSLLIGKYRTLVHVRANLLQFYLQFRAHTSTCLCPLCSCAEMSNHFLYLSINLSLLSH